MWQDINIKYVEKIEKCVAEYQIWSADILPYAKMKIKIYENQNHYFSGYTDVMIIRKYNNVPETVTGTGKTIEEALVNTINIFFEIVEEDYPKEKYPNGLSDCHIQYKTYSEF